MALMKQYYLSCDAGGCRAIYVGGIYQAKGSEHASRTTRNDASRVEGWRRRDGRDLCSYHAGTSTTEQEDY